MRRWFCLSLLFLLVPWAVVQAACTKEELQAEIANGPLASEIAPFLDGCTPPCLPGADANVLEVLNRVRAGGAYRVYLRIPASDILAALDDAELDALSDARQAKLRLVLSAGTVDFRSPRIRNFFQRLFPATGQPEAAPLSRQAVLDLAFRQGSRAEIVCGGPVTMDEVARAVRSPAT